MKVFKYVARQLTSTAKVLALVFGLSCCFAGAQVTILKDVAVIDGTGAAPQRNGTVVVAGAGDRLGCNSGSCTRIRGAHGTRADGPIGTYSNAGHQSRHRERRSTAQDCQ